MEYATEHMYRLCYNYLLAVFLCFNAMVIVVSAKNGVFIYLLPW